MKKLNEAGWVFGTPGARIKSASGKGAISRLINPRRGEIIYNGRNITRRPSHEVVQLRIAHSPEGRRVLARQTVLDNLELGAYIRSNSAEIKADINQQFEFPVWQNDAIN
ncbi:ABC transporter related [Microseira wollei NIES-4236]|uniref:ABC transporter related n=1 Tax=Microseira wollei NIES-4236 TaxID=2530354 RepID=A0AAV3XEI5_9CYAN|nr:ABC transporter related [Microseira wollei NIES-4236]